MTVEQEVVENIAARAATGDIHREDVEYLLNLIAGLQKLVLEELAPPF